MYVSHSLLCTFEQRAMYFLLCSNISLRIYLIRASNHEQMRIFIYTWMLVYIVTAVKYSLKLIGFVVFSCNSLIQALVGKSRALSLFPFVVYCTCCGWPIHTKTVHGVCFSSCNTRCFVSMCVWCCVHALRCWFC